MDSVRLDGLHQRPRLGRGHPMPPHDGPKHRTQRAAAGADLPGVRRPGLQGAVQILKHEVFAALRARFQTISVPGQGYAPSTEPDQAAGDILQAVRSIEPAEEPLAADAAEEAGDAVEEGFEQTRGILGALEALTGEVAESLSSIQSLVNQGLAQLSGGENSAVANASAVAVSAEYSRAERTEISILTQEGDVVRIRLGEQSSATLTAFAATDGGTEISGASLEASTVSRFQIRVKGDLNDEEMAAITALLEQAETLVDEFFSDGTLGAFQTVGDLGFDSEQLASFSLRAAVRERFAFSGVSIGAPVIAAAPETPVEEAPVTPVAEVPDAAEVPEDDALPTVSVEGDDDVSEETPVEASDVALAETDDDVAAGTTDPALSDASRIVLEFIQKVFDSFAPFEQPLMMSRRVIVDVMDLVLDASPGTPSEEETHGVDVLKQLLGAAATQ